MRLIKRFLLFVCELGILGFGFVFSLVLAVATAMGINSSQESVSIEVAAFSSGLLCGLILTGVGMAAMRRKTRPWEIECGAAEWAASRAERKSHPRRARYKRIAKRILVWAPSAIAAGVLFLVPVATHLVHPSSHYLRYYRVPIPWNMMVFSPPSAPSGYGIVEAFGSSGGMGRFGVTPFRIGDPLQRTEALSSGMVFESIDPGTERFGFSRERGASRRGRAGQASGREFQLGGVRFTCRQYVERGWRWASGTEAPWWEIDCETPVDVRERNLYARFVGRERDIPVFYEIIEGVRAVK
jgi:hypothetical protein